MIPYKSRATFIWTQSLGLYKSLYHLDLFLIFEAVLMTVILTVCFGSFSLFDQCKILPIWLKLDRLRQTLSKELLYTGNESSYILFNAVIYVKQIQIYTRYSSFSVQNLSYSKPIWSSTRLVWRTDLSNVIKTLRIEILGWDWNCQ